jgi:WhiB family transcriptional regulator, redox-sensing transcriptional regulator
VWSPANNLKWQKNALCAKQENRNSIDWFFSKEPKEKYDAKNLCFSCPVRKQCLQWALEHRQIWGIWGGKDEVEIRRALSVSYKGEEARRRRYPQCPFCGARPSKLETTLVEIPGSGRWTTAKIVTCTSCEFSWRSRTSANAVNAYYQEKAEREIKKQKEKEKRLRKVKKTKSS